MIEFPSIKSLRDVIKHVRATSDYNERPYPSIAYKGTVKLHGTNAGVRVNGFNVTPQGRTRELSIGVDNAGFAVFTSDEGRQTMFKSMADSLDSNDIIFFGEWCGGNIQKGVGLNQLDKHFVIFNAWDEEAGENIDIDTIVHHLTDDDRYTVGAFNARGIYFVNQIDTYRIIVDFANPEAAAEIITELTLAVENDCPWTKFRGGQKGVGEGIVWSPVVGSAYNDSSLWFKSKGLEHKRSVHAPRVEVAPEVVDSINNLVELILPQWRLEQGISFMKENNIAVDRTNTGQYIAWIQKDILKEESDTIAANGIEWKKLVGAISKKAQQYFMEHV